jgi:hypothetical protein
MKGYILKTAAFLRSKSKRARLGVHGISGFFVLESTSGI